MSGTTDTRMLKPGLLLLFVGSGCAALIYEIVWFQLLELVIGSSAFSLGVLLGTFMGGMCLGSLLLPRFISSSRHPLKVYGLLELCIAAMGILVLGAVPLAGSAYTAFAGHGIAGILLRSAVAGLCLIPPTLMMGATLPAVARWVETTREGMSWLGFFYAGNIAGAVIGCLLAGFYLLRVFDMVTATVVAVGINTLVGMLALRLAGRTPQHAPVDTEVRESVEAEKPFTIYVATALSGLSALGAEAIWTRQLSLVFGGTVYTFSIILAVFLTGLGLGSGAGSYYSRRSTQPRAALGLCQIGLTAAIAWASWAIAYSLPYWPIDKTADADPWAALRLDLVRCLWAILPAAILWGASFPLALTSLSGKGKDSARLVGGLYATNTLGAIAGALAFSALVIPWIGSQQGERILIAVSGLSGLMVLGFHLHARSPALKLATLGAAAVAGVILCWTVPPLPGLLVAYGREFSVWVKNPPEVRYVGEGLNSSVAVSEWPSGVRNFHVAGKIEASSAKRDMRLERMLGHLSALMHPHPRSVLVVGFGAGVTAGSFVPYPEIERIVICEIEPLIPKVVSTYFGRENDNVLHDPRVEVVYDDARHYILTTREKFDVITSDPIHPWIKGAATLYSTEYFEKVKEHLNPGGVVTQWVPLYDSTEDVVKSEFATFFKSLPNGTVWNSDFRGRGYDTVLVGQNGPAVIDIDAWAARLARPDYARVVASLADVGITPPLSILSTYAGRNHDLRPWLENAQINTDRNLRLQYIAGLVVNYSEPERVYESFIRYLRFPEDLFTGSPVLREGLRAALIP